MSEKSTNLLAQLEKAKEKQVKDVEREIECPRRYTRNSIDYATSVRNAVSPFL
ncbi:MAG: hypothetical protein WAZ77_21540 [Candidatus Nitrosopolaris sp.]